MTVTAEPLNEASRREIFAAIVELQDQGERPLRSHVDTAERFGINRETVIAREGLNRRWPPL